MKGVAEGTEVFMERAFVDFKQFYGCKTWVQVKVRGSGVLKMTLGGGVDKVGEVEVQEGECKLLALKVVWGP